MDIHLTPETYVMTVVSFGDRPAGTFTTVALRETAKASVNPFSDACDTIMQNIYVDDILDSVNDYECAVQLTKDVDEVLACGSIEIQSWIISKDDPNKINLNKLVTGADANTVLLTCRKGREVQVKIKDSGEVVEVQKVLGMNWNYCEDSFSYKVNLNFSKKKGNCRSEPNLLEQDVPNKIPECLIKRMILSQINGFFDPLGLVSAFIVKAKILWRKLWMGETKDWDDPISPELQSEWCSFFKEMFIIEKIKFERCTKPPNATDNPPILILFSDASINAYGTHQKNINS